MFSVSKTVRANDDLGPDQPRLSRHQIWQGLLKKAENALPYVKAMTHCELKERGETFKEKLRQANPYDLWLREIEAQDITFKNTIFDIELFRGEKTRLEIFVNFHSSKGSKEGKIRKHKEELLNIIDRLKN